MSGLNSVKCRTQEECEFAAEIFEISLFGIGREDSADFPTRISEHFSFLSSVCTCFVTVKNTLHMIYSQSRGMWV